MNYTVFPGKKKQDEELLQFYVLFLSYLCNNFKFYFLP
jgi:hypothetical protein